MERAARLRAYRQWIAFLGVIAAFGLLRESANYTGLPIRYHYAAQIDRWIGVGIVPTLRLQSLRTPFLDWVAILTWASFFAFPYWAAWRAFRRGRLPRYTRALALLLGGAVLMHVLVPTAPPWLAAVHGDLPPVARVLEVWGNQVSPAVYAAGNATAGSNPVAAMPSVHVGWVMLATLILDAPLALALGYGALMTLAVVYLGEHFAVDGLAGMLMAYGAWRWHRHGASTVKRRSVKVRF